MKRCTRKILLTFGLLLLLVFLFVPYRSTHIKFKVDPFSLAKYKMTSHQSGYMFVFKYLKLKSAKRSVPGTDQDSYILNKTLFFIELIIVIVLAPFDYFLFCVVLRRKK
jgi:hypothetical protein